MQNFKQIKLILLYTIYSNKEITSKEKETINKTSKINKIKGISKISTIGKVGIGLATTVVIVGTGKVIHTISTKKTDNTNSTSSDLLNNKQENNKEDVKTEPIPVQEIPVVPTSTQSYTPPPSGGDGSGGLPYGGDKGGSSYKPPNNKQETNNPTPRFVDNVPSYSSNNEIVNSYDNKQESNIKESDVENNDSIHESENLSDSKEIIENPVLLTTIEVSNPVDEKTEKILTLEEFYKAISNLRGPDIKVNFENNQLEVHVLNFTHIKEDDMFYIYGEIFKKFKVIINTIKLRFDFLKKFLLLNVDIKNIELYLDTDNIILDTQLYEEIKKTINNNNTINFLFKNPNGNTILTVNQNTLKEVETELEQTKIQSEKLINENIKAVNSVKNLHIRLNKKLENLENYLYKDTRIIKDLIDKVNLIYKDIDSINIVLNLNNSTLKDGLIKQLNMNLTRDKFLTELLISKIKLIGEKKDILSEILLDEDKEFTNKYMEELSNFLFNKYSINEMEKFINDIGEEFKKKQELELEEFNLFRQTEKLETEKKFKLETEEFNKKKYRKKQEFFRKIQEEIEETSMNELIEYLEDNENSHISLFLKKIYNPNEALESEGLYNPNEALYFAELMNPDKSSQSKKLSNPNKILHFEEFLFFIKNLVKNIFHKNIEDINYLFSIFNMNFEYVIDIINKNVINNLISNGIGQLNLKNINEISLNIIYGMKAVSKIKNVIDDFQNKLGIKYNSIGCSIYSFQDIVIKDYPTFHEMIINLIFENSSNVNYIDVLEKKLNKIEYLLTDEYKNIKLINILDKINDIKHVHLGKIIKYYITIQIVFFLDKDKKDIDILIGKVNLINPESINRIFFKGLVTKNNNDVSKIFKEKFYMTVYRKLLNNLKVDDSDNFKIIIDIINLISENYEIIKDVLSFAKEYLDGKLYDKISEELENNLNSSNTTGMEILIKNMNLINSLENNKNISTIERSIAKNNIKLSQKSMKELTNNLNSSNTTGMEILIKNMNLINKNKDGVLDIINIKARLCKQPKYEVLEKLANCLNNQDTTQMEIIIDKINLISKNEEKILNVVFIEERLEATKYESEKNSILCNKLMKELTDNLDVNSIEDIKIIIDKINLISKNEEKILNVGFIEKTLEYTKYESEKNSILCNKLMKELTDNLDVNSIENIKIIIDKINLISESKKAIGNVSKINLSNVNVKLKEELVKYLDTSNIENMKIIIDKIILINENIKLIKNLIEEDLYLESENSIIEELENELVNNLNIDDMKNIKTTIEKLKQKNILRTNIEKLIHRLEEKKLHENIILFFTNLFIEFEENILYLNNEDKEKIKEVHNLDTIDEAKINIIKNRYIIIIYFIENFINYILNDKDLNIGYINESEKVFKKLSENPKYIIDAIWDNLDSDKSHSQKSYKEYYSKVKNIEIKVELLNKKDNFFIKFSETIKEYEFSSNLIDFICVISQATENLEFINIFEKNIKNNIIVDAMFNISFSKTNIKYNERNDLINKFFQNINLINKNIEPHIGEIKKFKEIYNRFIKYLSDLLKNACVLVEENKINQFITNIKEINPIMESLKDTEIFNIDIYNIFVKKLFKSLNTYKNNKHIIIDRNIKLINENIPKIKNIKVFNIEIYNVFIKKLVNFLNICDETYSDGNNNLETYIDDRRFPKIEHIDIIIKKITLININIPKITNVNQLDEKLALQIVKRLKSEYVRMPDDYINIKDFIKLEKGLQDMRQIIEKIELIDKNIIFIQEVLNKNNEEGIKLITDIEDTFKEKFINGHYDYHDGYNKSYSLKKIIDNLKLIKIKKLLIEKYSTCKETEESELNYKLSIIKNLSEKNYDNFLNLLKKELDLDYAGNTFLYNFRWKIIISLYQESKENNTRLRDFSGKMNLLIAKQNIINIFYNEDDNFKEYILNVLFKRDIDYKNFKKLLNQINDQIVSIENNGNLSKKIYEILTEKYNFEEKKINLIFKNLDENNYENFLKLFIGESNLPKNEIGLLNSLRNFIIDKLLLNPQTINELISKQKIINIFYEESSITVETKKAFLEKILKSEENIEIYKNTLVHINNEILIEEINKLLIEKYEIKEEKIKLIFNNLDENNYENFLNLLKIESRLLETDIVLFNRFRFKIIETLIKEEPISKKNINFLIGKEKIINYFSKDLIQYRFKSDFVDTLFQKGMSFQGFTRQINEIENRILEKENLKDFELDKDFS